MSSILNSTKKVLGIAEDYDVFDPDIIMHINSAFSTLTQLGIGPEVGFMIENETAEWDHLLGGDPRLNSVKSLVYMKVRLMFDPPSTSYAIEAMKEQIREIEWRISVTREGDVHPLVVEEVVVDV